jgi:hypothetical protein
VRSLLCLPTHPGTEGEEKIGGRWEERRGVAGRGERIGVERRVERGGERGREERIIDLRKFSGSCQGNIIKSSHCSVPHFPLYPLSFP